MAAKFRVAAAALGILALAGCEPADERAQSHFENGQKLAAEGDTARALLEFREATRLDANLAGAYIAIAEIRETEKNYQSAVGHYAKAIEVDESNVPARLKLARIMLLANQIEEALRHAEAAVKLAPNNPEALSLRSSVAVKAGNDDLAVESANQALAVQPNASEPTMVLALLDMRNGDQATALERINGAIAADPTHIALNLFKLKMMQTANDKAGVREILERLANAYPDRAQFQTALLRWHLSQGDKEAAEKTARAYAAARPDDAEAAMSVVRLVGSQRGTDAARAELERLAADANSPAGGFPFEMALVQMDLNARDVEKAADRLETLVTKVAGTPEGDQARVRLAALRFAQGQKETAGDLVDKVLQRDSSNAEALALRAQLKLDEDRYDAAIQDVRLALAEDPENWRFLMLEAQAHGLNGAQSLMSERLGAAVQVSNYEVAPVLAYARHLESDDKAQLAEDLMETALQRRANDQQILRALAQFRIRQEDWDGAEEIVENLRSTKGNEQLADFITAQILAGQQKSEKSIAMLEQVHGQTAGNLTSLAALVASYVRADQPEKARALLDRTLEKEPGNVAAVKLKGDLHAALGEKAEAEAAYRAVIEAAPNTGVGYMALARFLISEGRVDDARAVADSGAKTQNGGSARFLLASLLEEKGDYAGAIEEYERLYKAQPQSFVIANNLASLLVEHFPTEANLERAQTIAKRLRATDVPQFQDTYGWILYKRGEAERALSYLQPSAEALPNVMLAQYHLGMAYAKAGINDRAIKSLERAVELAGAEDTSKAAEEARRTLLDLRSSSASAEK